MKCVLCGEEKNNVLHLAKGYACLQCMNKFPRSIRNGAETFTPNQLEAIRPLFRKYQGGGFYKSENLILKMDGLALNGFEYRLADLSKIALKFHPRKPIAANKVEGVLTMILDTRNPHIEIEEPYVEKCVASYSIKGNQIAYLYPSYVTQIFEILKTDIEAKNKNYTELKRFYEDVKKTEEELERRRQEQRRREEQEQRRREEQEQQEAQKRREEQWEQEKQRKRDDQRRQQDGRKKHEQQAGNATHSTVDPWKLGNDDPRKKEWAMDMFRLKDTKFTETQIKKIYRRLSRKYHPDNVKYGNEEIFKHITTAYDVLNIYAISDGGEKNGKNG